MKKTAFILMALAFAVPAWAGVQVSCREGASGEIIISYDASGETELVRAFALDVTVDGGATITGYSSPNASYGIYPGSIVIDGSGNVTDAGSPIADPVEYPNGTLGGLNTSGVTIEMGSLYASGDPAPAASGDLITLQVDTAGVNVSIAENVIRGGVVMEDPAVPANAILSGCVVPGAGCPCKGDADASGDLTTDDMNALLLHLFINGDPGDGYRSPCIP
jgi:hypothetical protein